MNSREAGKPKKSIRRVIRRVSSKKRGKEEEEGQPGNSPSSEKATDVEFLAFIWGTIFAAGVWAAFQSAILSLSWRTPPTVADFVGTLAFAAVAIILLTPAVLVLSEIARGRFAEMVERARKEKLDR